MNEKFENLLCERGDAIDNAVYQLLLVIMNGTEETMPWDMALIGPVADAVESALAGMGRHICRPYYDGDDTPCFVSGGCGCPSCPMADQTESKSFIELCICGKASPDDIDDYVEKWHSSKTDKTLCEFLGFTLMEHLRWLKNGNEAVKDIIEERKRQAGC